MQEIEKEKPADCIRRTDEVRDMLGGIGKTRFSQLINDPEAGFPRPVKLNGVSHGFIVSEVVSYIRSRPRVEPSKPLKPFTGLTRTEGKSKRQTLRERISG